MQDPDTGEMVKLAVENDSVAEMQKAIEQAQVHGHRRGPVFMVGEKLEVKGGWFRIMSVRTKGIVLKSIKAPESTPEKIPIYVALDQVVEHAKRLGEEAEDPADRPLATLMAMTEGLSFLMADVKGVPPPE